eukprot:c21667_g1_i1.p1 GENE.c21667_g1_i1~~c21667_g1_i1.p1  ORF type:complete len:271 (-),score=66.99 c21667_g1_i1:1026-1838(-)
MANQDLLARTGRSRTALEEGIEEKEENEKIKSNSDLVNNQSSDTILFTYLYSSPLVCNSIFDLRPIHFIEEKDMLTQELTRIANGVVFNSMPATNKNLKRIVDEGCRCLHLSGHGVKIEEESCLVLEHEEGSANLLTSEQLNTLIHAGNSSMKLDLVFLSACKSSALGEIFVRAGVKHVVTVTHDGEVQDSVARKFACEFYHWLFAPQANKKTVRESFDIAIQRIATDMDFRTQSSRLLLKDNYYLRMKNMMIIYFIIELNVILWIFLLL